jgi:ElaB/YqjD/DUF883 family membrane-anchored ribosome-binding protein/BMFP domain-containing protein YqiC
MTQDPTWGDDTQTVRPTTEAVWTPDASAGDDPEVERLTDDIERTRGDMTETLEELGDRLNPSNVIHDAKATVREATVGKVESMASDVGMTARETGEGIIETIKRNPLPAALAGIGIGWLWMSRDKSPSWARASGNGRRSWSMAYPAGGGYGASGYGSSAYGSSGYGQSSGVTDKIGEAGQQVSRTASEVASGVGNTASDVADRARQTAGRVPEQVGEMGQQVGQMGQQVGDTAQRMIEENPLAVAGVALAVGAAVGLALPVTRTEQRTIGQAGAQLIDQAANAATKPMEKLEDKAREVESTAASSS